METLAVVLLIVAVFSLVVGVLGMVFDWLPSLGDEWPFKLLGICFVSFVLGLCCMLPPYFKDQHRLMEQCMQDLKEYECAAMLKPDARSSKPVVPVERPTR
jgi:hypothetical protein